MSSYHLVAYLILIILVSATTISNCDHVNGQKNLIFSYDKIDESRTIGVRIVNDLLSLEKGVHVDFSFNETVPPKGGGSEMVSAPGCPLSYEGRPWVYYGSPPKCYLVGFRGPCEFGRRIFSVENSKYGVCNCDCFAKAAATEASPSNSKEDSLPINEVLILPRRNSRSRVILPQRKCNATKSKRTTTKTLPSSVNSNGGAEGRYQFCLSPTLQRLVVFDKVRQECNAVLDQGPCMKGEWLLKSMEKDGIECEKRKCPEFTGYSEKDVGGGFTYFDYKTQECETQVYGALQDSFFANTGGITADRQKYCRNAGMKYSYILKTCIRDTKNKCSFSLFG